MAPFSVLASRLGASQLHALPAMTCGAMAVAAGASSSSREGNSDGLKNTSCEAAPSASSSSSKSKHVMRTGDLSYRRRMTQVGRFSILSETVNNPSVTVLALVLSGKPFTSQDFIKLYQNRKIDEKHERFSFTLDPNDLSHFIRKENFVPKVSDAISYPIVYRNELKHWIESAVVEPMNLSEGLWQARTATGGGIGQSGAFPKPKSEVERRNFDENAVESLLLFRSHHCMADGVSMGAIFGDLADEGDEIRGMIAKQVRAFKKRKKSWWQRLQILLYYWWWGSIKSIMYQIYLHYHSLIGQDPWKLLKAKSSTSSSSRTLSWVQIDTLDQVKEVTEYFSQFSKGKVTLNDVFCSCVSSAIGKLIRYHQARYPDLNLKLSYLNLVIPVHMQGGVLLPGQALGNRIGALVGRIPSQQAESPEDRLMKVHSVLWDRKQTPAAVLSFLVAKLVGATGVRLGGLVPWVFERAHAKASVAVTNVRGPDKPIHFDGRRVEAVLGFLPLPPGIPIGIAVTSNSNRVSLTVIAEPWAVPDADLFLSWVVEEYQQLLQQAKQNKK